MLEEHYSNAILMAPDASSLHCPNCGASADSGVRRCPYCQARLATVSCPACFALMFDGIAFCPTCGTARARGRTDDAGTQCPACEGALCRIEIGPTTILECGRCDGVWVDADVFERLCADRESQAVVVHHLSNRTPAASSDRVRYRPCPRCGKMMNRVNFAKRSGAVVDVCRGHGTFLDAGELHQIVTFIQNGGLERARAQQMEDLRDEERRIKALETRVVLEKGSRNSGAWEGDDLLSLIEAISRNSRA
jgi:Zn-finger nucleic acid-binding protein